jgi:hypothetical protein
MVRRTIFFLSVLLLAAETPLFSAKNGPSPALQKLQSLAGDWAGKDDHGEMVKTTFKSIAGETAVMELLVMPGMEEMVTIYSQDGDGIALLHYCPTNNQPRMRAVPGPGELKELVFAFEGAGNLASPDEGHEHKLVIQFQDRDHIIEHWTWRSNGKDTEMVYRFARKNVQAK